MDRRVGLLFLLVLGITWLSTDARTILISDFSALRINQKESKNASQEAGADINDNRICKICEQFTAQAIDYLSDEKTQAEIIGSLHHTCSQLPLYKAECSRLVDYYTPLFFQEVAMVQPKDFCDKVNLCGGAVPYSGSCDACHKFVKEIQDQLKDPDSEFELIEKLVKACDRMPGYTKKQCKAMVLEYAPLLLSKVEKFLEKEDLCTFIPTCKKHSTGEHEAQLFLLESPLLSNY